MMSMVGAAIVKKQRAIIKLNISREFQHRLETKIRAELAGATSSASQ
jgi:hypothetical protein